MTSSFLGEPKLAEGTKEETLRPMMEMTSFPPGGGKNKGTGLMLYPTVGSGPLLGVSPEQRKLRD